MSSHKDLEQEEKHRPLCKYQQAEKQDDNVFHLQAQAERSREERAENQQILIEIMVLRADYSQ